MDFKGKLLLIICCLLIGSCCSNYSRKFENYNQARIDKLNNQIIDISNLIEVKTKSDYINIEAALSLIEACIDTIKSSSIQHGWYNCNTGLGCTVLINLNDYGGRLGLLLHNYFTGNDYYYINPILRQYNFEEELWLSSFCHFYPNETIVKLKELEINLLLYLYNSQLLCE